MVKLTPPLQLYEASYRLRFFLILLKTQKKFIFIDDGRREKQMRDRDIDPISESNLVKF